MNKNFDPSIELRTAQVLSVTEDERDEWSDKNPIIFAEQGPNRFQVMSWFFPEEDGVNVTEDTDTGDITIKYFKDGEPDTILEEGALYEWALNLYREG